MILRSRSYRQCLTAVAGAASECLGSAWREREREREGPVELGHGRRGQGAGGQITYDSSYHSILQKVNLLIMIKINKSWEERLNDLKIYYENYLFI